ncbi:hypothetical protein AVEN_166708-1 [Araneus ventricosus]|uniref:Uncharacterized protein n=1 Tax=Araneus ventricosus TaxID=182803 RepID=A0A4Y2PNC5_ARAVE|nr:hypothetical protein AVEN_166708-1 [Araneus ventricosus]
MLKKEHHQASVPVAEKIDVKYEEEKRQKKSREEKKKKLSELCEAHPHVKEALKIREKCGRPRLEADQPELSKAIVDIAIHGSAAHENRQSDVYRSIKTLDELIAQLKLDGFSVSRSGVYLRLLPKRSSTLERKRHVVTAPVKLIRAQNDSHLKRIDNVQKDGLGRIEAVGYSGPTYVAIRSGKHTTSTASSHGLDFERLLELPEFDKITKFDNAVKLVVVFVVDGGPDENPRYQKTIQVGVHHFRQNTLGALFIAANAPGRSAFNTVERKMAPLSKELSGLILPYKQIWESS